LDGLESLAISRPASMSGILCSLSPHMRLEEGPKSEPSPAT
jgi:hypothetical protein